MPSKHIQCRVPVALYEWLGGSKDANLAAKAILVEAFNKAHPVTGGSQLSLEERRKKGWAALGGSADPDEDF